MEFRSTTALRGHKLVSAADDLLKTKTYGFGRVCEVEGCNTRLSAYNPSNVCALHSGSWEDDLRHVGRRFAQREEVTRRCAYENCSREFTTTNPAKKYCCDACRMKAFQARVVAARRVGDPSIPGERQAS